MIGPDEAVGTLCPRIDQHHSALKIIDQDLVGLLRNLINKPREKSLRLVRPISDCFAPTRARALVEEMSGGQFAAQAP